MKVLPSGATSSGTTSTWPGRRIDLSLLLLEVIGELLRLLLGLLDFLLAGSLGRFERVAALPGQLIELLLGLSLHVMGSLSPTSTAASTRDGLSRPGYPTPSSRVPGLRRALRRHGSLPTRSPC